jgi:hypothetical protein
MWFDEPRFQKSWANLWAGYIRCGNCLGIRRVEGSCPACEAVLSEPDPIVLTDSEGREYRGALRAFMGAEGRYEDWVYLMMLEPEWKRPLGETDGFQQIIESKRPASRAVIVVVFWSYFETRVERLLLEGMRHIPENVRAGLLRRYSSIGSRLDRLYQILFSSTYFSDLRNLGCSRVASLIQEIQARRNHFTHGSPEAITDTLVSDLVAGLKDEHEAWIAVFNKRTARVPIS